MRLYQLEAPEAFERAAFDDLWSGGPGPSVVAGPDELVIVPGRNETRTLVRNPKATHLAIAGKFRIVQDSPGGFRAITPLPAPADPCGPGNGEIGLRSSLRDYAIDLQSIPGAASTRAVPR